MESNRCSYMEVDLKKFENNMTKIQNYVGKDVTLIPIIKANGYGTYVNEYISYLNTYKIVAVALVDEAKRLRQNGFKNEILVINQPAEGDIDDIIENNITIGISSKPFIEKISSLKNTITVHIEIETGMGRTGIDLKDLEEYISLIKNSPNIKVEGIYTHLSSADIDEEYTNSQLSKFDKAVDMIKDNFEDIKYIHCNASNGILYYKDHSYNAVRPGIIMYGYESNPGAKDIIDIEPICKLRSQITFLKKVPADYSISYCRRFITKKESIIATVPLGYADGIRRSLTNKGHVVIRGKLAPMVGSVCMDSFMVDVTDIPDVSINDTVYIWDNENITLDEIAKQCDTINYEIMSGISSRVPRKFI